MPGSTLVRKPLESNQLSNAILHPVLWKWILFAGQPFRFAIAINIFLGKSVRSITYDLLRRLKELVGWLSGHLKLQRFARFERRYFLIRRWHAAAIAAIAAKLGFCVIHQWKEHKSGRAAQRRVLRKQLLTATNYSEWFQPAEQLDVISGRNLTRQEQVISQLYDRKLLEHRIKHLKAVRERGDVSEMMFALRSDLIRNLGNMANPQLHEILLQAPKPIREYIDELRACLRILALATTPPVDERLAFLRETRHAFGRTALVLSGGGSFGSFHLGVVDALLEAGLLPRVLSGSSAGAIVAALICTRTDEELTELFSALPERLQGIDFYGSNTATQIFKHLVLKGTLQDHTVLQERLQRLLGDVTFQEAHARSGRVLNVSVSAADTREPPRLLNYLTSPNVIVWSAVACSSAFPFLFAPQTLLARDSRGRVVPFANQSAGETQRRWRDGSLEEDLPMRGLSEMFNVNYFLVSQCNPYLLPIIAAKKAAPRTIGNLAEQEFKHRCKQLMEVLPRTLGASRVLKLLSQPWEGDITMVLPASSLSTLKAVVNLSREDLLRSLAEGQRAAWAKLSAIAANCDIEVALDETLRQVTSSARRARARMQRRASTAALAAVGGGGLRGSMPSWLHLQALGLAHSESHETLTDSATPRAYFVPSQKQYQPNAIMIARSSPFGLTAATTADGPPPPPPTTATTIPYPHPQQTHHLASSSLGEDLTETIMPEESELLDSMVSLKDFEKQQQLLQQQDQEEEEEELREDEEMEGEVMGMQPSAFARMRNMSLGCGDEVWKDLFTVVPATTSDALDFIAP